MIFVTGATGLLGNCVVRELVQKGEQVRVLCRPGSSRKSLDDLSVQIVDGDLADADNLCRSIDGCQAVVHCAALIHMGWSRLEESRRVNVDGTRNIVQACLVSGAKLVYVSTVDTLPAATSLQSPLDETPQPGVPKIACNYVVSKCEAEEVVRRAVQEQNLDATIVQPGFMLGPNDWAPSSGRLMLGVVGAPIAFAPTGGCSLCDARDVAAGAVAAIDKGRSGHSYILAGENMPYRELWYRILRTADKRKPIFCVRRAMQFWGWLCDRWVQVTSSREGDVNSASIAMAQLFHYYVSAKAQAELGYSVRPANQTLEDAWHWLQHHSH